MTETPKRIQLRRTKGWRKPEGAVVVSRPSRWGNPFTVASAIEAGMIDQWSEPVEQRRFVTMVFRDWLAGGPNSDWWYLDGQETFIRMTSELDQLAGKDLACWCPLDQPCHADVLIEHANGLVSYSLDDRQALIESAKQGAC